MDNNMFYSHLMSYLGHAAAAVTTTTTTSSDRNRAKRGATCTAESPPGAVLLPSISNSSSSTTTTTSSSSTTTITNCDECNAQTTGRRTIGMASSFCTTSSSDAADADANNNNNTCIVTSKSICVGTLRVAAKNSAEHNHHHHDDDTDDDHQMQFPLQVERLHTPMENKKGTSHCGGARCGDDEKNNDKNSFTTKTNVTTTTSSSSLVVVGLDHHHHHHQEQNNKPDIYGQVHPVETPELIRSKLNEFDAEVKKLQTQHQQQQQRQKQHHKEYSHCTCLLQAMEKCPELLTDEFKLQFLRCEVFHTQLAVQRYCKYWEARVELCGESAAFQPQTLDEQASMLSPQDIAAMQDGLLQLVCGVTDPMGRALLYLNPSRKDMTKYSRTNILRACAYVIAAALESESAQKHGAVIFFDTQKGKLSDFDIKLDQMLITGIQGKLPMRLSAVHVCHPQSCIRIIWPLVKVFMPERMRKRIQIHKGSNEDILKRLQVYGLDKNVVPTELGGNVKLDHIGWLEDRRARGL